MDQAFGTFGRPKLGGVSVHPQEAEDRRDAMEEARDRVKAARKESSVPKDPLGDAIKAKGYVENKLFPAIFRGATVSVSRFYPDKNAAVDIFEGGIAGAERMEIAFKRSMFKGTRIKYAALEPKSEMASLLEQLGV